MPSTRVASACSLRLLYGPLWIANAMIMIVMQLGCTAAQSPSPSPTPQASLGVSSLFAFGSTWKVLDADVDLASSATTPTWKSANFNDSTWVSGPAPIGYGYTGTQAPATTVSTFGIFTYYLRKKVTVSAPR